MTPGLLVRRIGDAALLIWLVVTLMFVLVHLAPGDPATLLLPPTATAADAARLRATFGLDQPLVVQYARWGVALLRGDLGESFALHVPVAMVIREAARVSLGLGVASVVLTFVVGIPLGMLQAAWRGRMVDRGLTVLTASIFSAPTFWVALALVAFFTYGAAMLGLPASMRLPAIGVRTPGVLLSGPAATMDLIRHAVLPVLTLAAVGAAGVARYARANAVDVIGLEFVRAARARGAARARVFFRHVLPNAAPSLIVLFALTLPGIVAGSVFVESVFAWPGLGKLTLAAIAARDYPVILGAGTVYAIAVIAANLAADVMLPIVDPRRRRVAP